MLWCEKNYSCRQSVVMTSKLHVQLFKPDLMEKEPQTNTSEKTQKEIDEFLDSAEVLFKGHEYHTETLFDSVDKITVIRITYNDFKNRETLFAFFKPILPKETSLILERGFTEKAVKDFFWNRYLDGHSSMSDRSRGDAAPEPIRQFFFRCMRTMDVG